MTEPLAAAHLAVSGLIIVWNTLRAGRIATARTTPRLFAALSGLGGLLLVPALLIRLATSNALYARSVEAVAWMWPLVLGIFAAQALYALLRRMSHPFVALPILVYDVVLLVTALTEHALVHGVSPSEPSIVLLASHRAALALVTTPAALASTTWLMLPILAPAFPARWSVSIATRAAVAVLAAAWVGVTAAEIPFGLRAIRSYAPLAELRLRERTSGSLAVGASLFPSLAALPNPITVRDDLAIADSLAADAVSLVLEPAATRNAVLDSLRRAFDDRRRGGMLLIVSLGWERGPLDVFRGRDELDLAGRVAAVDRIARRLRPDYLLPVLEPYGTAARQVGALPPERWRAYLTAAARAAHEADRRVQVAYAASTFDARDSTLFAWAASAGSPIDAVGLVLRPTSRGGASLTSRMQRAESWLAVADTSKDVWVFAAGGLPLAHGEIAQRRAVWGAIAWGSGLERVQGVIVADARDYARATGLRSALGRLRPALAEAQRAAKALREAAMADSVRVPAAR